MTIARLSRGWTLILVLITGFVMQGGVAAQSDGTEGATPEGSPVATAGGFESAAEWLVSQQGDDGGFLGLSGDPDASSTVDAIFGLVAAQRLGIDTSDAIAGAVEFLQSTDIALVYTQTGVGQAAKLVLGLNALGMDPHNIANVDPLAIVSFGQNSDTGVFGLGVYDHALAMLALTASGEAIPENAISALQSLQAENGGWAFDGSTDDATADSNTTSMVIQALAATGMPNEGMIEGGLGYLRSTLRDGQGAAYNSDPASLADSNSTALVAQAVIATGSDPSSDDWQNLIAALLGFQNADGSIGYQASAMEPNLLSTAQALPALANLAFPIVSVDDANATPVGLDPWKWLSAA